MDITRRRLLQRSLVLSLGLLAGCESPYIPLARRTRVYHVGYLSSTTEAATAPNLDGLRQGLRELGYVDGQNLAFDLRYAEGKVEPLSALARELVALRVDVIVPSSDAATRAATEATSTLPIVFATLDNPVANGYVASLGRPGGNATGIAQSAGQESAKRLDLLKECVPGLSRAAVLWSRTNQGAFDDTQFAAQDLGIQVVSLEFHDTDHVEDVLQGG